MIDEDKNLLELAAKAAGYALPSADDHDEIGRQYEYHLGLWVKYPWGWGWFRPHLDDGDALRLAVKLQLGISIPPAADGRVDVVTFNGPTLSIIEYPKNGDRNAATRRAIVRAAAEIGNALVRTAEQPDSQKSVDPVLQMLRDEEAKKAALIAKGICPTCKGRGECGGQFTGGEWVCEDCNGSGRIK